MAYGRRFCKLEDHDLKNIQNKIALQKIHKDKIDLIFGNFTSRKL